MKINYTATLLLPAITASLGVIGKDIDITAKLDKDGNPYFNGKHIKGILKERVRQFKSALCDQDTEKFIEKYFGKEGNDITESRYQKLRFSNLILKEPKDNLIGSRYGIKIDRRTKSTVHNSLFNYEYLKAGTVFSGNIECADNISKEDLKFLLASLFHLNFIGGFKSRGLGKVEIKVEGKGIEDLDKLVNSLGKDKKDFLKIKQDILEHYNYELKLEEPIILKEKELGNYVYVRDSIQGSTVRGAVIESFLRKNINIEALLKIEASQAVLGEVKLASTFETKYKIDKLGKKVKKDKVVFTGNEYEGIKLERGSLAMLDVTGNEISVEINEKMKSAKKSMLFNTEFLYSEKSLKGDLAAPKGLLRLNQPYTIYIGKVKSKGFGKATITFSPYKEDEKINVASRIEKLNKQLGNSSSKVVTFDLTSDLILPFNEIWDVSEQFLELLPFENDFSFNSQKSFINVKKMGGYNIVNNSRKMDELILCRGSVITYNTSNYNSILKSLEEVELKGLGLRKNEGFGRVKICSVRGEE